ncbi:pyridoxamine kinase [Lachnospiraceae bacterium 46-15]
MIEENRKPVTRVAVIHDICGVGKAAMTNILPVLSVMGIEVCPLPTMVLSAHTGGYGKPVMRALPAFVGQSAGHLWKNGIRFDDIFVGYLGDISMVEEVRTLLRQYPEAYVLLDPIMADHGVYYQNYDETYGKAMRKLLEYSDVITPNYTESCFLAGESYEERCTEGKLYRICEKLRELGARQTVITSVPISGAEIGIAVCGEEELQVLRRNRAGRAYPGTGDLFAAVLKGSMIQGKNLVESVVRAHDFVSQCIKMSDAFGYPVREGVMLEPNLQYL